MKHNHSDLKRRIAVLTMTEHCNLKCTYCFETAKSKRKMPLEVAKSAVFHEFTNSDGFDEIEFDLFGGEPTLNWPVVRALVEWTATQSFPKPYIYFLETNGTLVHGRVKQWLLGHRHDVCVGVSLDGTPETHNRNRSNSYDRIDIRFFADMYPDQSVRMTVHCDTLHNLSRDVMHLHSIGFKNVVATFAHGVEWDDDTIKHILPPQLEKLADFYIKNPDLPECSIFDMDLSRVCTQREKIEKWCGSGTSLVSYAIDGARYPCHTFQSNTTNYAASIKEGCIDFSSINDFADPGCAGCLLEPICPNCYGMNYVNSGNILRRDKRHCQIVKLRALATSYLRAQKIADGTATLNSVDTYRTITAIKEIKSWQSSSKLVKEKGNESSGTWRSTH